MGVERGLNPPGAIQPGEMVLETQLDTTTQATDANSTLQEERPPGPTVRVSTLDHDSSATRNDAERVGRDAVECHAF